MTELTSMHFLIVCPLVFIGGFVDAIAGGGGLISLPAYMLSGLPVHYSIATNKLSSAMGTAVSTAHYAAKGMIPLKLSLKCTICAAAGSAAGARIALMIDDYYFKLLMLVILPLTAVYITKNKSFSDDLEPLETHKTALIAMAAAFFIGAYDGFYGPGTGTFLILVLTAFAHLSLSEANGIAKVINLTTNIASLTVYLLSGKVLFALGLAAGIFGIAGNYIGAHFFTSKGGKITRPIMFTVIVIFFIKILSELLPIWH